MVAKDYWNKRYIEGIYKSGPGSYGEQLDKKLNWLKDLPIKSITEIGCGDFNFGKHLLELYPKAFYIGSDISDIIIEKNRQDYPEHYFHTNKITYPADLLLCIDVLFHVLDDEEYEELLERLTNSFTKYLAITAYENEQSTSSHLKIRKFDYKMFGEPIIREVVEESGSLYFYLWKRVV